MLKNDVGYLIKCINDRLKVKADLELKKYNLTMAQCRILEYLGSRGGTATQKEIEVFWEVSHPTVVGLISRMEQNGYVKCRQSDDRRNKIVALTPQAESISREMKKNIYSSEQMLLAPLSMEERECLKRLLMIVADHLS